MRSKTALQISKSFDVRPAVLLNSIQNRYEVSIKNVLTTSFDYGIFKKIIYDVSN